MEELLKKGVSKYVNGDYWSAIKSFNRLLKKDPTNVDALIYRGLAYLDLKKYTKAIENFKNATKANPKHYKAFNSMGLAYEKLNKNYNIAINSFRKSINANSEYPKPYISIFKLQLFDKKPFDKKLERQFIDIFKNQKEIFMQYEMFLTLQNISNGNHDNFKEWKNKYKNNKLLWRGFKELRYWAKTEYNTSPIIRKKLLTAIAKFKNHKPIKEK